MALIACLNCGHQISDSAIKCPKCNRNTVELVEETRRLWEQVFRV